MVHLLLDGFDELATRTISSPTNKNYMRQARREALRGIRELVTNTPAGTGVLLCGRDNYFDDIPRHGVRPWLTNKDFHVVQLGEFNEEQVTDFLGRRGITEPLPTWLPRKPLILGYLAHKELLQEVLTIDGACGFGHAWDSFLTLICKREAEYGAMSDQDIRHVLEAWHAWYEDPLQARDQSQDPIYQTCINPRSAEWPTNMFSPSSSACPVSHHEIETPKHGLSWIQTCWPHFKVVQSPRP